MNRKAFELEFRPVWRYGGYLYAIRPVIPAETLKQLVSPATPRSPRNQCQYIAKRFCAVLLVLASQNDYFHRPRNGIFAPRPELTMSIPMHGGYSIRTHQSPTYTVHWITHYGRTIGRALYEKGKWHAYDKAGNKPLDGFRDPSVQAHELNALPLMLMLRETQPPRTKP